MQGIHLSNSETIQQVVLLRSEKILCDEYNGYQTMRWKIPKRKFQPLDEVFGKETTESDLPSANEIFVAEIT